MTLLGRYPADVREKAVEAVDRRRLRDPRDRSIFRLVASEFGVGEQSLRLWVKRHDKERLAPSRGTAAFARPADESVGTPMERELDDMRRQIQKLRVENDILKRAFVMFSAEWSKPEPPKD